MPPDGDAVVCDVAPAQLRHSSPGIRLDLRDKRACTSVVFDLKRAINRRKRNSNSLRKREREKKNGAL